MKRSYQDALRCKFDGTAVTKKGMIAHLYYYHKNQVPAQALEDAAAARQFFATKEEYKEIQKKNKAKKALAPLDKDKLYSDMVHFYRDKKGYSIEDANRMAQNIVDQQIKKRQELEATQGKLF